MMKLIDGVLYDDDKKFTGVLNYSIDDADYHGEFKEGLRDGKGMMLFSDNNIFEGQWKCGKREGKGKLTHRNAVVYEGFYKDDLPHGFGKSNTAEGIYEGLFENGKKSGRGTMRYSNGDIYLGEWADDKWHSLGKITTRNKDMKADSPKVRSTGTLAVHITMGTYLRAVLKMIASAVLVS